MRIYHDATTTRVLADNGDLVLILTEDHLDLLHEASQQPDPTDRAYTVVLAENPGQAEPDYTVLNPSDAPLITALRGCGLLDARMQITGLGRDALRQAGRPE